MSAKGCLSAPPGRPPPKASEFMGRRLVPGSATGPLAIPRNGPARFVRRPGSSTGSPVLRACECQRSMSAPRPTPPVAPFLLADVLEHHELQLELLTGPA